MNDCPNCPSCNSTFTVKSGQAQGRQRYRCNKCDRYFTYAQLVNVESKSDDADADSTQKEIGVSLLGVSFGLITTALLFLSICGLLVLLQLDIKLQPKLPETEKR